MMDKVKEKSLELALKWDKNQKGSTDIIKAARDFERYLTESQDTEESKKQKRSERIRENLSNKRKSVLTRFLEEMLQDIRDLNNVLEVQAYDFGMDTTIQEPDTGEEDGLIQIKYNEADD